MNVLEFLPELTLYFFLYSFLGWVAEFITGALTGKKAKNRGVLFGPYCPIYGFGALLVFGATYEVRDNWFLVFLVSMLTCSSLEYLTSFILERMFHIRWWDYSKTEKFNLNGRICLSVAMAFGIFGIIAVQWAHPIVESIIALIPDHIQIIVASVLTFIILLDLTASIFATHGAKKLVDFSKIAGDQTAAVKKACRDVVKNLFKKKQ